MMAHRLVDQAPDPRAQGIRALRWVMPVPGDDEEAAILNALLAELDRKTGGLTNEHL